MAWAATVELILQQHSLTNADLLGEGGEAQVYALGPDHVVRFGKAPADRGLLERMLASCGVVRPELVHGNYCPANLMVGADGLVTGLIDFGPLTVMGDWRMDAAGAVLYLTGMAGVTPEDKRVVLDHLMERGLSRDALEPCRLFYAFRFLDTSKAGLLRWRVDTIRSACQLWALPERRWKSTIHGVRHRGRLNAGMWTLQPHGLTAALGGPRLPFPRPLHASGFIMKTLNGSNR